MLAGPRVRRTAICLLFTRFLSLESVLTDDFIKAEQRIGTPAAEYRFRQPSSRCVALVLRPFRKTDKWSGKTWHSDMDEAACYLGVTTIGL